MKKVITLIIEENQGQGLLPLTRVVQDALETMNNFTGNHTLIDIKETPYEEPNEIKHVLGQGSIDGVILNEKIKDEELHEFYIVDREGFIDDLIGWIAEARSPDKYLMKEDLEELLTWEDDFILTSNSTNTYIGQDSKEFNETCEELLALNDSIE